MFRIPRKVAIVAVTAVLGTGLLGSAALAAFAPAADYTFALDPATGSVTLNDAPKGDALKTILDGLVSKNVITQAQESAILAAVKDARGGDRDAILRKIVGGLLQESATYLGIQPAQLRTQLPGTSLGAIADKTGKSRSGLVSDLTTFADAAVDKAVTEGKLTHDQATTLKAALPDRITKFVDHTWPAAQPKPNIRAFIGDVTKDARDYLGLSQKDIASQLRAGKSLGDIAQSTSGKSRDGLIAAIMDDANAKITKAASDGKLTDAQAGQLRTAVRNAVVKIVDHKGTAPKSNGNAPKPNN